MPKIQGNFTDDFLSKFLPFEKSFDTDAIQKFSNDIKSLSLWCSVIYMILIAVGRRAMQHRPAFRLQVPLVIWNVTLTAFSVIGFIRTVPELVGGIYNYGWAYSVCDKSWYYGTTGFWGYAFTISKLYEFGDTAFIVLRRQPLIFLHWYHHITVMIYCFYSYPQHVASGRWYMVMNYGIHSTMYAYFTLRALRFWIPGPIRMGITSLQIIQMIAGLTVAVSVYFLKRSGIECYQSDGNVLATVLMYVSYFILFIRFFYNEYAAASKKPPKPLGPDGDAASHEKKL